VIVTDRDRNTFGTAAGDERGELCYRQAELDEYLLRMYPIVFEIAAARCLAHGYFYVFAVPDIRLEQHLSRGRHDPADASHPEGRVVLGSVFAGNRIFCAFHGRPAFLFVLLFMSGLPFQGFL
jgi:hypothetical protein